MEPEELRSQSERLIEKYRILPDVSQDDLYDMVMQGGIESYLGNFPGVCKFALGDTVQIGSLDSNGRVIRRDRNNLSRLISFMNPYTPNSRVLLYHPVGSGKTRKGLTMAMLYGRPITVIVMHNNQRIPFDNELQNREGPSLIFPEFRHPIEYVTCNTLDKAVKDNTLALLDYYFKEKVVIIDESHHIRGEGEEEKNSNSLFKTIINVSDKYPKTPLIFLTATPVVDGPEEIYGVYKLLLRRDVYTSQILEDGTQIIMATVSDVQIASKMKGYVSALGNKGVNKNYKAMQELDVPIRLKHVSCRLIPGSPQAQRYSEVNTKEAVQSLTKAVSRFATQPGTRAEELQLTIVDILSMAGLANAPYPDQLEYLANYSIKYYTLAKMLLADLGRVKFVFDDWKERGGAIRLVEFLTHPCVGFVEVTSPEMAVKKSPQTYRILALHRFASDVGSLQRLLQIANSEDNRDGSLINVIIGTPRFGEGTSIPSAASVIIVSHPWNNTSLMQKIGRANRRNSLGWIPKEKRVIDVYILELENADGTPTIEYNNRIRAEEKYFKTSKITNELNKVCIELLPLSKDGMCPFTLVPDTMQEQNMYVRACRRPISHRVISLSTEVFLKILEKEPNFIAAMQNATTMYGGGRYVVSVIHVIEECWRMQRMGQTITNKQKAMLDFFVPYTFTEIDKKMYHLLYFVNSDTTEYQRLLVVDKCVLRVFDDSTMHWNDCEDDALIRQCYASYDNILRNFEKTIMDKWRYIGFYAVEFAMPPCVRLIEYKDTSSMASKKDANIQDKRKKPRGEKKSYYNKVSLMIMWSKYMNLHPIAGERLAKRLGYTKERIFNEVLPYLMKDGLFTTLPI